MLPPLLQHHSFRGLLLRDADIQFRAAAASQNVFSPVLFLARWLEGHDPEFGLSQCLEKGEVAGLRAAFVALSPDRQDVLLQRWGRSSLERLFNLSRERNLDVFLEDFFRFGTDQSRTENRDQVYAAIRSLDPKLMPNNFPELSRRAGLRLQVPAEKSSFGERSELWLRSLPADGIADGVNRFGAVLGLATIVCYHVSPLRPLAAAGIGLLSNSIVAGSLLAAGSYTLYRQAPEAGAAVARLWNGGYLGTEHNRFEDGLLLSGYLIGALGIGVGLGSFALGARVYGVTREAALLKGYSPAQAASNAYRLADTVRRAVQDPEIWLNFARSRPNLAGWKRTLLVQAARWADRSLVYGSALIGTGKFGLGLQRYFDKDSHSSAEAPDLPSLLLDFAVDVFPGVTTHLYRLGRGARKANLGPPLSQELREHHYDDLDLRQIALGRHDRGISPLSPAAVRAFIRQGDVDLHSVERFLDRAKPLTPLTSTEGQPHWDWELVNAAPLKVEPPPPPVAFLKDSRRLTVEQLAELRSSKSLAGFRAAYDSGKISPVGVLEAQLAHPLMRDGSIFPHDLSKGTLLKRLRQLAKESQRRFETGTARPLEGMLLPVKDLFIALDGRMYVGSKTSRITGVGLNPVVEDLIALGCIPVPVGMVAGANGGSAIDVGFGYVSHPSIKGKDPKGSSGPVAFAVAHPEFLFVIGLGTDTGGSTKMPAQAVGIAALVPPAGVLSTKNMVPFFTPLDHIGLMGHSLQDVMTVSRLVSRTVGDDPHLCLPNPGVLYQPNPRPPKLVYLQSLVDKALPETQAHFLKTINTYRESGYEVIGLGSEWDFVSEVPFLLYPFDAYVGALFTHTNPLQKNLFEPPRLTLDGNMQTRLPKGAISLRIGFFDRARRLSKTYENMVSEKFGDAVMIYPSTELASTADLMAGKAGPFLDNDDRVTMAQNRISDWGQITIPSAPGSPIGVHFAGRLPSLMHFTGEYQLRQVPDLDIPVSLRSSARRRWPTATFQHFAIPVETGEPPFPIAKTSSHHGSS